MKKFCAVILTIALSVCFCISSLAEEPKLEVVVNSDGSVTVTSHGRFSPKGDSVGIYKSSDVFDPNVTEENTGVNPLPIVSWVANDGIEITYPVKPGKFDYIPVSSFFRVEELQDGYEGSALRPGKYYAVVLSGVNFYQFVTEPVPFEIPEITATPEPTEITAPSPSVPMDVTPANPSDPTPSKSASAILWVSIAAAVGIIIAVIIVILMKRKKK